MKHQHIGDAKEYAERPPSHVLPSSGLGNFAANHAAETPYSLTTLCREVCPRTSSMRFRGISNSFESNPSNASFAAESTGGAVTLMRIIPAVQPQIWFTDARGCNLTDNRIP